MSKKRKCSEEHRKFQEKWEELYFVCNSNEKVQCLICCAIIAVHKEYNIRRHYESLHKKKYHVYKGKMRQEKMSEVLDALGARMPLKRFGSGRPLSSYEPESAGITPPLSPFKH